jgi:voltage-gated potassium channel Kch
MGAHAHAGRGGDYPGVDHHLPRLNQVQPATGLIAESERVDLLARMSQLSKLERKDSNVNPDDPEASHVSERGEDQLFHPKTGKRPKRITRTSDVYKQNEGPEKVCWKHYKIIHPSLPRKIAWDLLLGLIIVYSVCCIPYRIGFDDPATGGWDIFDIICDLTFAMDMLLNLNTAYEAGDGDLVIDRAMIVKNYVTGWFAIDFASTFPVDRTVEWMSGDGMSAKLINGTTVGVGAKQASSGGGSVRAIKLIRVLRLIRLIKLARLLKLSKILGSREELLEQINPIFLQLSKTLFIIIFVAHFLACFWHFQALEEDEYGKRNCDQWLTGAGVKAAGAGVYSIGDELTIPVCDGTSTATLVVSAVVGDHRPGAFATGKLAEVVIGDPPDGYCQVLPTVTTVTEMAKGGVAASTAAVRAIFDLIYEDKVSSWRDNYIGCDISTVPHSTRYVASFYWTVATITGVGYGDVVPISDGERFYSIFGQLVGAAVFGIIIGDIGEMLSSANQRESETSAKLDLVRDYLEFREQLPAELKSRLLAFFEYSAVKRAALEDAALSDVTPNLRSRIYMHTYRHFIRECALLRNCVKSGETSFVIDMLMKLQPGFHVDTDVFMVENAIATELIFIRSGMVQEFLTVDPFEEHAWEEERGAITQPPAQQDIIKGPKVKSNQVSAASPDTVKSESSSAAARSRRETSGAAGVTAVMGALPKEEKPRAGGGVAVELSSCEFYPGSYVGDMGLLLAECKCKQPVAYKACGLVETLGLSKEELDDVTALNVENQRIRVQLVNLAQARLKLLKLVRLRFSKLVRKGLPIAESGIASFVRQEGGATGSPASGNSCATSSLASLASGRGASGGDKVPKAHFLTAKEAELLAPSTDAALADGARRMHRIGWQYSFSAANAEKGGYFDEIAGWSKVAASLQVLSAISKLKMLEGKMKRGDAGEGAGGDGEEKTEDAQDMSINIQASAADAEGVSPPVSPASAMVQKELLAMELENLDTDTLVAEAMSTGVLSGPVQPQDALGAPESPNSAAAAGGGSSSSDAADDGTQQQQAKSERRRSTEFGAKLLQGKMESLQNPHSRKSKHSRKPTMSIIVASRLSKAKNGELSEVPLGGDQVADGGVADVVLRGEIALCWEKRVIHPSISIKQRFDLFIGACVMYSVVSVPVRIGFGVEIAMTSFAFGLDCFVDIMFLVDMCANFRCAYHSTWMGSGGKHLVTSPRKISRRYLLGWFSIDFISTVPIDLLVKLCLGGSTSSLRSLKLVRLVRLLKLMKLLKLGSIVKRLEKDYHVPRMWIKMVQLTLSMFFMSHFLACVFAFTFTGSKGAGISSPYPAGISAGRDLSSKYLAAVYWAMTTMTTVGYGDILPRTDSERIFVCGGMLVGAVSFSFVVGSMAVLAGSLNVAAREKKDKMREVRRTIKTLDFPPGLSKKVKWYYRCCLENNTTLEAQTLAALPESLRQQVVYFLNQDVLEKIPLFTGQDPAFVGYLMSYIKPQVWIIRYYLVLIRYYPLVSFHTRARTPPPPMPSSHHVHLFPRSASLVTSFLWRSSRENACTS